MIIAPPSRGAEVEDEEAKIRAAILVANGNLTQAAKQLDIARSYLTKLIRKYPALAEEAATRRAAAHTAGPRPTLQGGRLDPAAERDTLLALVAEAQRVGAWDPHAEAKKLGYSHRQFYRLLKRHKVEPPFAGNSVPAPIITERKASLEATIKALETLDQPVTQVALAKAMGVSHTAVAAWLREFDFDMSRLPRTRTRKP